MRIAGVWGIVDVGTACLSHSRVLVRSMSILSFFLYWRDKHQARSEGWRTPEKFLHGAELLGGWPGVLLAQQLFRHKTRKVSYQTVFWLIIVLHELFWIDRLLLGGRFLARHLY